MIIQEDYTESDFYYSSYNLFICDVDSIYTNILLAVFIQCFYFFCDYIWTVSLQ